MWQTSGAVSHWVADSGTADVQLEHPEQGIRFASPLSDSSVQLLRIGLRDATAPLSTPRVVDHYIRQKDLVVTYEYDQPQMRMQLYWRHATWRDSAGGSLTGLCLLLSLQTNRLDSRPTVTVATEIACEKVDCFDSAIQPMESNAVLGDPPMSVFHHSKQSLVLMAHPTDIVGVKFDQPDATRWQCAYELVGEHLEKGVIRRVQLGACFLPPSAEHDVAPAVYHQFVTSPLPLTV